jgi:2-polyprenyl-6-methoxyphenol hydroxylase-like FAD-dependent oxidoreductase
MNIEIIGAGPAGLYTAILLKSAMPTTRVQVTEQNPTDAAFGFGVVFSDTALDFLQADDPETHALIAPLMQRWSDMTLSLLGKRVTLDGIGFSAIGRLRELSPGFMAKYDRHLSTTGIEEKTI